ncbi:transmembrane protein 256 homolog [Condylostylus longicornis]|uniref:transmembrane protein 256 homolog n=1 Tax=Condylostylus longicornis TaxID=2530218 RepID=UPI00244E0CCB|nr:transmembrane protein 256 homolog [Condylostylus longicornis]
MNNVNDSLHYIFVSNPVSQNILSAAGGLARKAGIISSSTETIAKKTQEATNIAMSKALPLWKLAGKNLYMIRLAGLSGATAVILGAYGSHRHYNEDKGESKAVFEVGNRFHFFHSIALMAVPMCRQPVLTGCLIIAGTLLFSGPCYYKAFTGKTQFSKVAPIGGCCLILAWLSMMI